MVDSITWLVTSPLVFLHRPYGTPERMNEPAYPTLKRGTNNRCAYGAVLCHTSQRSTAARRLVSGSRTGTNSCAT